MVEVARTVAGRTLSTEDVRRAIEGVLDPCSRFNGANISLVELGMVRAITVTDGTIVVELLLDDPACPYSNQIVHELRQATAELSGGRSIEFVIADDEVWTTARMSERARRHRADMRRRVQEAVTARKATRLESR